MGQRHNRRRTRPRSRRRMNNKNNNNSASRLQQAVPPQLEVYGSSLHFAAASLPPPPGCSLSARNHCHDRVPSAQLWHNRYMAWHGRGSGASSPTSYQQHQQHHQYQHEQRQEASAKLEAEQCRLFGGEPGDDVTLCFRMLEFFGGLDFIE